MQQEKYPRCPECAFSAGHAERCTSTQRVWEESVERWGMDHTHDISCRTWNPRTNWAGACDCTLPRRAAGAGRSEKKQWT